jgi:hypothetical protein
MNALWQRWVRFWSHQESATSLCAFRILVCAVTLYSLISIAAAGLVDVLWVAREHGGMIAKASPHWIWQMLPHDGADAATATNVWAVYWVALGGATLGLVGLGGRWPLLVAQQCYVALTGLNGNSSGSYDTLITIALLVLVCSRCTASLSLDSWLEHHSWVRSVRIAAWPRYLLLLQLLVMYTATGFQKIGLSWTPMGGYTALHYVLHDPTWTRFPPTWVPALDPLLRIFTAVAWHWEQLSLLMLLVLYYRSTPERPGRLRAALNRYDLRIVWAMTGIGLHLGILVLMNVGPFSWISMSYYLMLWRPDELEWAARRVAGRLRAPAMT